MSWLYIKTKNFVYSYLSTCEFSCTWICWVGCFSCLHWLFQLLNYLYSVWFLRLPFFYVNLGWFNLHVVGFYERILVYESLTSMRKHLSFSETCWKKWNVSSFLDSWNDVSMGILDRRCYFHRVHCSLVVHYVDKIKNSKSEISIIMRCFFRKYECCWCVLDMLLIGCRLIQSYSSYWSFFNRISRDCC